VVAAESASLLISFRRLLLDVAVNCFTANGFKIVFWVLGILPFLANGIWLSNHGTLAHGM